MGFSIVAERKECQCLMIFLLLILLFAALPEVTVHDLSEEWDFIVIGCDGIWDVLTNQAVVNFIIESVGEGKYPENICEELLTYCLAPVMIHQLTLI
jgi:serine/threonine protein phosphatase PrpC